MKRQTEESGLISILRYAVAVLHGSLFPRFLLILLSAVIGCGFCPLSSAAPPVTGLSFAPGGESVVVGSQSGIDVRNWPELEVLRTLDTQLANVHHLAFSPDGAMLAAAGGTPAEEGIVEMFAWPSGNLIKSHRLHDDLIYAVAWRGDGAAWGTASVDRTVRLHETATGKNLFELAGHSRGVMSVAWLTGDEMIVSTGLDGSVRVWEDATGKNARSLDSHTAPAHALAVRPSQADGALPMLATIGRDHTARLWQPTIGRMVRFVRLASEPLCVAWTRDGRWLIVSCTDGHLRLIDPVAARVTADLPAIKGWAYSLAVPPSGNTVLVGGSGGQLSRVKLPEL